MSDEAKMDAITIVAISSINVNPFESLYIKKRRRISAFFPQNLNTELVDEVIQIANETAFLTAQRMAALEGIPAGISSGAAVAASLEVGQRPEMVGKLIVTVLPSFAERYLSTALFDGLATGW